MSNIKKRDSNFELLRIIAMFMIIANHYGTHGGFLPTDTVTFNVFLTQFLSSFGKLGASLFVLISGYFLIDSSIMYKKLVPLISKMFFYSYSILIVITILKTTVINEETLFISLLPIFGKSWFINFYIILYLFLPFLNKLLISLSKKSYSKLVLTIIIIWSFIPTIVNFRWYFSGLDYFLALYTIGAFFKLHLKEKYDNKYNLIFYFVFVSLIMIYILISLFNTPFSTNINYHNIKLNEINHFLSLMSSLFLFLYFKNLKFTSNTINKIASNTFDIYLIHDNPIIRPIIWQSIFPNINYVNSDFLIIHFVIKVIMVFIISFIVSIIYSIFFEKYVNIIFNKLFVYFKSMFNKIGDKLWKTYL